MAHRRMEDRREGETETDVRGYSGHIVGLSLQRKPQSLQHIGGAARRGGCPVAVLDHLNPAGRHDHRCQSGDVHRPGVVPSGSHDVDAGLGERPRSCGAPHRLRCRGDLVRCFALDA